MNKTSTVATKDVKVDKNAGEMTKSIDTPHAGVQTEPQVMGVDHNDIAEKVTQNQNKAHAERLHDNELNKKKAIAPDRKVNDSAIFKAIEEDAERVKSIAAIPADHRTKETGAVLDFYYGRMNDNVKKLHGMVTEPDQEKIERLDEGKGESVHVGVKS